MADSLSIGAMGFIGWAISPYAYMVAMVKLVSGKASTITAVVLVFLVGAFGVCVLVDTMFVRPDAQSGPIYVFAPVWQWVLLSIASLPVSLLNGARRT